MSVLQDSHNPSTTTYIPASIGLTIGAGQQANGANWLAQTFTAGANYTLYSVALRLAKNIRWPDTIFRVRIRAVDGSHKPTGADLATQSVPGGVLPQRNGLADHYGAEPWTIITFDSPADLTSGTEYAIILEDPNGYIFWTGQTAAYAGYLVGSTDSGSSWSAAYDGFDLAFQTFSNFALQDNFETGTEANIDAGGTYWVAQSFTPGSDYIPKSVALRIERVGTAAGIGNIEIGIRATAASKPSGGDLTVATIYGGDVATGALAWYEGTFDVPYKLTSGTEYAIVVRSSGYTYPAGRFQLGYVSGGDPYADGKKSHSDDYGSTWTVDTNDDVWFRLFGIASSGVSTPISDSPLVKRLVAAGGNQLWYEDEDGDMIAISSSVDDIDTSNKFTMVEAYGKIFIANGDNKKVADFSNVKISTADIGTHPPDFGTTLTGGTTGATMSVDYIDAIASAVNIYGRRTSSVSFQNNETVTGTDDDGNAISFTLNAEETLPPHWYDWTPYGNDTTNFGTMPSKPTLVSKFNGRLVLAGDEAYPHQWWMSEVYNPWNWAYTAGSNLTAISSGSINAGEIADVITALIDYGDDFFVFGCQSSIYLLDGDPTYGGTIESLTDHAGVYGARAWCKDHQSNLYFFSGEGLYKADGGRRKPISLSAIILPNWSLDWDLNPDNFRVVCTFDPVKNGIIISHTSLLNGSNQNYWYDIKTAGFYPEGYPDDCGIFSSFYYNSLDNSKRVLLLGCNDGYLRSFYDSKKDDVDASDADIGINSWFATPVIQMNENLDNEGKLTSLTFVLGGGATDGTFLDSDSMDYELFVGDDAETVLEDILDDATEHTTGTISTTGRSNRVRSRARGRYLALRLSNTTDAEAFVINKIYGIILPVGR